MTNARCILLAMAAGAALLGGVSAKAQETTTYAYDAKGRVTNVTRSGGPSNGVATTYQYDAADNRYNVTVTNSPNGAGGTGTGATAPVRAFYVVPLNGLSVMVFAK